MYYRYSIVLALICPASSLLAQLGAANKQAEKPPRAARSVHLGWQAPEATAFYNELTVKESAPGSYFMAAGFRHGYFGIQEQAGGRKVVIFSVWDPTKGNNSNAVPEDQRVEILFKADDVMAKRFGGEGTGAQSFFEYPWKIGQTYRFLVKAKSEEKKTAYSAYFWLPEQNAWKHLVTFRTRSDGDLLKGLYSFIEDFRRNTTSATQSRRAIFGNGAVLDADGKWHALTKAHFTASGADWEAKDSIDAGISGDVFYLQTGGATKMSRALNSSIECPAGEVNPPEIPAD